MTRLVLLAAALAVGGGGVAAALPHGQGPGSHGDRTARLKQELGLSDDQMVRLREIRESRQRDAIRHRADAEVAHLDLRRLLDAPTVDRKAVDAKVKEIADLQSAGLRARVDTMLAMREVLTPAQRQKWQALGGERHRDRWQRRDGRRSSGRGWGVSPDGPPKGGPGAPSEGEER
jgi:Spy/CpxP family protein refolding chaperone